MKKMYGRDDNHNLIIISELNTSNEGYFMCYYPYYKYNFAYRKNLKNGYLAHVWQSTTCILRIYNKLPRIKKKLLIK